MPFSFTTRIQVFVSKMLIFEAIIFVFSLFRIFASLLNMNIKCVEILQVFENIFFDFKKSEKSIVLLVLYCCESTKKSIKYDDISQFWGNIFLCFKKSEKFIVLLVLY